MEKCVKARGTPPIVLFQGEYCCLVNKHSSLAEKETVVPQDLKEHYLSLKSRLEAPSTAMQPVLDEIVPVISPSQVIQTESVDSVINLVRTQSDVYALSYYPILKRVPGSIGGRNCLSPLLRAIIQRETLSVLFQEGIPSISGPAGACYGYPGCRRPVSR